MASTPSWSAAVAAVHADPILANASPPIVLAVNTPFPGSIGESQRAAKAAPGYAVWMPTRDRYTKDPAPRGPSPATVAGPSPRWLLTRWVGARIHLNCLQTSPTDFDTVELTVNAFLAALHRQLRGAFNVLGGELERTGGTELAKDRKVYVLDVEIATPITEVPVEASLAAVTSAPVNAGVNTPTNPPS